MLRAAVLGCYMVLRRRTVVNSELLLPPALRDANGSRVLFGFFAGTLSLSLGHFWLASPCPPPPLGTAAHTNHQTSRYS